MSSKGKLSNCLPAINYMHDVDPSSAIQVKKCFEHIYGKQEDNAFDSNIQPMNAYARRRNSTFATTSQISFKTTNEIAPESAIIPIQKDAVPCRMLVYKDTLPIPKWHMAHIKSINKLMKKNKILSDYQKHGHIPEKKPKENLSPLPQFKSFSDRRVSCPNNARILNNEAHSIINELSQTRSTLANSNDTLSMLNINFIQMKKSISAMRNQNLQFTLTNPIESKPIIENKSPKSTKYNYSEPPAGVYQARKHRSKKKLSQPDSESINYFIEKNFDSESKDISQLRREHSKEVMKSDRKEKPSYMKKGMFMQQLQEMANNLTHYNDEFVCSHKLDVYRYKETNYRSNRLLPCHKIYFFRTKYTQ